MFSGSIPALVTPMRGGAIDETAFRALVDWQVESGSSALVPCGTTGESATMTIEEHDRVVALCVEQAAGRVPVIAGCGSNDTRVALAHMQAAERAGAAAALECRLTRVVPLAGEANFVVLGVVTGVHIRDDCVVDGRFDPRAAGGWIARLGYRDYAAVTELFEMERPA